MNKRIGGMLVAAMGLSLLLAACGSGPAEESHAPESTPTSTTATTTTITTTTTAPLPSVGYCTADPSMHVRVAPGPYEEVIGGLAWGEQVNIVGKEGDWYRITFKDGFAYVSAQYIAAAPPVKTTATTENGTTVTTEGSDTTATETSETTAA